MLRPARIDFQDASRSGHANQVELLVRLVPFTFVLGTARSILFQLIPFRSEKIVQASIIPSDTQPALHFLAFNADDRLGFPVIVIKEPARKHLFGSQSFVGRFAVKLYGKVFRQGLPATDENSAIPNRTVLLRNAG